MTTNTIVLVRHARSAHVHTGLIDLAGFHRWREDYESAGIDARHEPPPSLRAIANESGILAASTARRANESAKLLAPDRTISTSPLLTELELLPPNLPLRLPLIAWTLAIAVQWVVRVVLRRPYASAAEMQRSRDAAAWLIDLAARNERVLAVTHGSLRLLLSDRLIEHGWRREVPRNRNSHWSAWVFHK